MLKEIISSISEEIELFEKAYLFQFQSDRDFLRPLLNYIGKKRGKRLRPILFFLSQGLVRKPDPNSIPIAVLLELLHTATLVHDDIVDNAAVRRGEKTVNALWGDRVSVLVGDYLLAKVLALGVQSCWKGVLDVVSRVVMDMGRCELRQSLSPENREMREKAYFQLIQEKTAGLFAASCELGGLIVPVSLEEKKWLNHFGDYFGMVFQIRDDILDVSGHAEKMGKPVGQDVFNGKATLPLILALEEISEEERQNVITMLKLSKEGDGKWIAEFIKKNSGLEKAQERAEDLTQKALAILKNFKSSVYRDSMERLVMHNLERVK